MSEDSAFVDAARPRFAAPGGLAQTVILAWGWRRRGIAFVGGAAGALAMPPVDFPPALIAPMALADAEDVDTIGGLLTATAGRVPIRGEIVAGPGDLEFEVLDADPRRVKRLRVQKRAAPRRRSAAARALAEPNQPPESGAAPGDK